ncbi:hypothetical protein BGZ60DRAFT_413265 [Tricladium varicosporioides]|nr:hypothetical protein BGZ60DRAFT_413265 [Hymenoscyphus varicosporioides]
MDTLLLQPSKFTLFPNLPPELRLKIYTHIQHLTTPPILHLNFSPFLQTYIPTTPSPLLLSLSPESRSFSQQSYTYVKLGALSAQLPIPILFPLTTLYLTLPPSPPFLRDLTYHLSTSPSRHQIKRLAIDLRVWNELCEGGVLGVLAGMRKLEVLLLVVEFGRSFNGILGFLEAPEWRGDLRWLAGRAREGILQEKKRGMLGTRRSGGADDDNRMGDIKVRCVILTRGGEHA